MKKAKLKVPRFKSDEEAAKFLEQDLSNLDFSKFKPVKFEFEPKDQPVTIRFPKSLVSEVKLFASKKHMPYQRVIRLAVEQYVHRVA